MHPPHLKRNTKPPLTLPTPPTQHDYSSHTPQWSSSLRYKIDLTHSKLVIVDAGVKLEWLETLTAAAPQGIFLAHTLVDTQAALEYAEAGDGDGDGAGGGGGGGAQPTRKRAKTDPDETKQGVGNGDGGGEGDGDGDVEAAEAAAEAAAVAADMRSTRIIIFTSGTTGHPKGVQLSYGNYRTNRATFEAFLGVGTATGGTEGTGGTGGAGGAGGAGGTGGAGGRGKQLVTFVANPMHHTNSTAITDWSLRRPGTQLHLIARYEK